MSPLTKFLHEGQDPKAVEKLLGRVGSMLAADEEVYYLAVQKKPIPTRTPHGVALTNRRIIFCRPRYFGFGTECSDYPWEDVLAIHLQEDLLGTEVTISTARGTDRMEYLPKAQARRLHQFGQTKEEDARELRRQRDPDHKRVGSGRIAVNAGPPPGPGRPADDPLEKQKQLKAMLKHRLITQAEYDERLNAIPAAL